MLRAGGQQKPYTAPVYEGYRGVIQGLVSQGWKSFFKGLLFRSIHQSATFFSFYQITLMNNNVGGLYESVSLLSQLFKLWTVQFIFASSLNMFNIAENRYILQNNIPEFKGTA